MTEELATTETSHGSEPGRTGSTDDGVPVSGRPDGRLFATRLRRSTSYCADTAWVWQRARFVCAQPD